MRAGFFPLPTTESASSRNFRRGSLAYSNDCIQTISTPARESDLLSAGGLWNAIMGGSGSNPYRERDQPSTSLSQTHDLDAISADILVVEDSNTDVFLIREALETAEVNASVHVVTDGHAAIQFFDAVEADENARCPVLVLLDMNLPKRSGSEVLNHLRQSTRCRAARVIVVSSSDAPRDRASVGDLAVAAYFKKPSDYAGFMKLGPLVKAVLEGS
jgi:CheY-like chemotaxis protein